MTDQIAKPVKTEHERILALEEKVARLEQIIEKRAYQPISTNPFQYLHRCHQCGIHLSNSTSFACTKEKCPLGVLSSKGKS